MEKPYVRGKSELEADKKKDDADLASALADCKANNSQRIDEFDRLMKTREYWPAAVLLRRCSQVMGDATLVARVANAEIKSYRRDIAI